MRFITQTTDWTSLNLVQYIRHLAFLGLVQNHLYQLSPGHGNPFPQRLSPPVPFFLLKIFSDFN